jgi:hypothetical protein
MSAAIQYVINESAHLWKQPLIPAKSNIIGYVERLLKFEVQALRQEMGYTITMPKKGGTSSSYFESLRSCGLLVRRLYEDVFERGKSAGVVVIVSSYFIAEIGIEN